jgi:hypothetical protein
MTAEVLKIEMISETMMSIMTNDGVKLTLSANRDDGVFTLSYGDREYLLAREFLDFIIGMISKHRIKAIEEAVANEDLQKKDNVMFVYAKDLAEMLVDRARMKVEVVKLEERGRALEAMLIRNSIENQRQKDNL